MRHTPYKTDKGKYWRFEWDDAEGKRHRPRLARVDNIPLIEDAIALRDQWIAERQNENEEAAPTLRKMAGLYESSRAGAAPSTIKEIRQSFGLLLDYTHGGHDEAAEFGVFQAIAYGEDLYARLSLSTQRKHLGYASRLFAWGMSVGFVQSNPFGAVRTARPTSSRSIEYLSVEDTIKLINEGVMDPPTKTLIALCRYAGLRRSEALRVEPTDFDFINRTVTVRPPKRGGGRYNTTKAKERLVPIIPLLHEQLRHYTDALPIGPILDLGGINRQLRASFEQADMKPRTFQDMRASAGQDFAEAHGESCACSWLGHSPKVAAAHYRKPTPAQVRAAAGLAPGEDGSPLDRFSSMTPEQQRRLLKMLDDPQPAQ